MRLNFGSNNDAQESNTTTDEGDYDHNGEGLVLVEKVSHGISRHPFLNGQETGSRVDMGESDSMGVGFTP